MNPSFHADASDTTPHDIPADQALLAIARHRGLLLLDLDETLYLRNSTEDFIDTARPRTLALLLLRLLDALRPWRWTGGAVTRDAWRVRLILSCFPATTARWRREVAGLAERHGNAALLQVLGVSGTVPSGAVVATAGFLPIVAPLVAALGLPGARIVAVRVWHFADRRVGKLHLARQALGDEAVRASMVLTDSSQDRALLDHCARPLRVVWPGARFQAALGGVYLPGQYLSCVKRPGERYIVRAILQEDYAFWLLSSVALAAQPLLHALGLLALLLSFWAIYERGYVDNDRVAARHEAEPKLSAAFHDAPVATPAVAPWLWALASAAVAVVLLRGPLPWQDDAPWTAWAAPWAGWTLVLLATQCGFALYNRCDKATRVWLFVALQFARSAAFVVLVPILPIGAVALGAHVLARWVPYHVYRLAGRDWPGTPVQLMRLMFFIVLALLLALAQGMAEGLALLASPTALALFGWNLLRARQELVAVLRAATRIDRIDHPDLPDHPDPLDRSLPPP
ncbi:hypothetical protein [Leptothrix discophora]|uniref:Haloacid dehalogenase-like hydrolase n=1 Tax=Leptothrix discophora TaxID=89 RepID=A0ABT9G8K9_LEPDI|nr:hypothetical protein [Leptothrix discophora]MDP4302817.1 hypothetical protein [Leptothrix discophora]